MTKAETQNETSLEVEAIRVKSGRRRPLQYMLPALIIALLMVSVGVGSFLAYREVRAASLLNGEERLERVSGRLAEVLQRTIATSLTRHGEVAGQPVVRAAVAREGGVDSLLLSRELAALRPIGVTLPVELWDAAGDVILRVGDYPEHWSPEEIATARARIEPGDRELYGPLFLVDDVPYAWVSVPVLDAEGRLLGRLARVGAFTNGSADQIAALVGSSARIFLANTSGGPWVTLDGEVVEGSRIDPLDSIITHTRADGEIYQARAGAIGSQPLVVVAESPLRDSLARPAAFLRELLAGAFVLLLIGAVAAWLLSRRITRPLTKLSAAADGIARGDYSSRVQLAEDNELGDLARAFSHMAGEVESTHLALQTQYEEARDLALRLEESNERIVDAMLEAEQARTEAEMASRAKSEFLATMSHEIRTPINAIVGYADLMQMEISGPLTEEQRAQLNRLTMSSRHLLRLVNEVLDLASVESGNLKLSEGEAGAIATIRTAAAVVAPDLATKGLGLSIPEDRSDDLRFHGDTSRVEQILINLLANAGKFTPSGGEVEVTVSSTAGRVGFVVADNGPGIPAEQQEAIFEPFVQVDSSLTRAHGGAGLGLAISRKLATLMGGELLVESSPGQGSRFILLMPRAHAKAEAESA